MQKIGLIELAHHNEVLRSYIVMLLERENTMLYVFTNKWIYNQCYDLHDKNITWKIKPTDQSSEHFLNSELQSLDQMDLIILTTHEDSDNQFNVPKTNSPIALVIHDLYTNFKPLASIKIDLKYPEIIKEGLRVLKFFLTKKRRLTKGVEGAQYLLLPSQNVLEYARTNFKNINKFYQLPFTINDEISKISDRKITQITIPGNISSKSRDYINVYKAFQKLPPDLQIELNLLGRPDGKYGNRIIEMFSTLENVKLIYSTSFIPQKVFDQVMRNTDFLILPMNEIMKFGIIGEKNGYSCVSGNINDMVRYGIPAIIPRYYPLPNELKEVALKYSSPNELSHHIQDWIVNKTFNSLKRDKMRNALEMYSKKRTLEIFDHNFTSINSKKL